MCLPGTVEIVREQVEQQDRPRIDRRTAVLTGVGAAVAAAFPGLASGGRPATHRHDKKRLPGPHARVQGRVPRLHVRLAREGDARHDPDGRLLRAGVDVRRALGTHMDAPGHFTPGGRLSPEITLEELIVPIVVIDISRRAEREPDTTVTVDDLRRFERRHGRIPEGSIVCMDSGWAAKVDDPLEFKGGAAFPNYHFPGFSVEAAMWLAERRKVTGIGVDTISLDPGNSATFPVHVDFLATDRYGLEGLNNLDKIPPRGAVAYVGLIPWEEGSGGPCRVIASW